MNIITYSVIICPKREFGQVDTMELPQFDRDAIFDLEGQTFIWDKVKANDDIEKHGISFEEAASVFVIDGAEEFEDEEHSDDEDRLIVIGLSKELRVLTVIHCWREDETIIRIISARKATKLEQQLWMRWQ